ncbi:MAG: hypothetical protein WC402_03040 [Candidatus Pacearchaeota archaeon]|jgi:hypothetical protein
MKDKTKNSKEKKEKKVKKPITVKEEQDEIFSGLKKDIKESINQMEDIIDEKDK